AGRDPQVADDGVGEVVGVRMLDEGAAAVHGLDQAALAQTSERLAHHRPADAELRPEALLGGQLRAGLEPPGEDPLLDLRGESLEERQALKRLDRRERLHRAPDLTDCLAGWQPIT